jgi:hypothetical protein
LKRERTPDRWFAALILRDTEPSGLADSIGVRYPRHLEILPKIGKELRGFWKIFRRSQKRSL